MITNNGPSTHALIEKLPISQQKNLKEICHAKKIVITDTKQQGITGRKIIKPKRIIHKEHSEMQQ